MIDSNNNHLIILPLWVCRYSQHPRSLLLLLSDVSQRALIPVSSRHSYAPLVRLFFLLLHLLPPPFPFSEDAICAHSGIYTAYLTYSKHDCGGEEGGRDAVSVSYQRRNVP